MTATQLNSIFAKPVDRDIEGVIKADANNALKTEVEEYVITGELESRLVSFLDAYNNYSNANGVWISGFFGSGKSHLLKMLALLLEKRPIEDCDIASQFAEKCDAASNPILKASLTKAINIPSQSILFNIDQKADVISKTQLDALLAVFVKVFDEHCGYYGKQAYIAHFERKLDEDGLFDKFQAAFEATAGMSWDEGRKRITRMSDHIDTAHKQVTGASQTGVMDAHRQDYRLSIEDFAINVRHYIDSKPKGFRLNFFVDEVGQYIADNVKLMTNLQTIAESLATRCNGQAWVIVTAQEDMSNVIGEMTKAEGNDFSKIQARFKERMKLSSTDVAEVIQKRLLKKDEAFEDEVGSIYDKHANNFNTLLTFGDGSQTYRNYKSRQQFIECYPFVPYQFELFQLSIRRLSEQDAFEGRHQSVGERSMLGVFQDVAKQLAGLKVGAVATFDMMYEGLRSVLKSQMHSAISTAEKNLDNKLAIQVLKALFLVKYIREFKASIRNLGVLMLDHFERDISRFEKDITEAVNLLESQSYIQRNGDLYEFLTNEEKDVEQEIKNTDIDLQDVADELQKIVFDQVLKQRKIRYADIGHDYDFTRKLDDKTFGREHELSVNIITPFHEHTGNTDQLKMSSMGRKELIVAMPSDPRLVSDLYLLKRTEKYVRQNQSLNQRDSVSQILSSKMSTNKLREQEIQEAVRELLSSCIMFVGGTEVEHSSKDPQVRLVAGFGKLVEHEYTNLKMLQGITYTEDKVSTILTDTQNSLFESGVGRLTEAEAEMLAFINREIGKGLRVSVQSVVEHFQKGSNGWYLAAIQCILAQLCARGKLDVRSDSNVLTEKALADVLLNTRQHVNLLLEPQIDVPQSKVRELKTFYQDFFDEPAPGGEVATLGKHVAHRFDQLATELKSLLDKKHEFPFLSVLEESSQQLSKLAKEKYNFFFDGVREFGDDLLDRKDNLLDPIRQFMNGTMAEIYADARRYLIEHRDNLDYVQSTASSSIRTALDDAACYQGNTMQTVKAELEGLKHSIRSLVQTEQQTALDLVESRWAQLKNVPEYSQQDTDTQNAVLQSVEEVQQKIRHASLVAVIRDLKRRFDEESYPYLLSLVSTLPEPEVVDGPTGGADRPIKPPKPKPIKSVAIKSLSVTFEKAYLVSEQDVTDYLQTLKSQMLEEIAKGHRIQT